MTTIEDFDKPPFQKYFILKYNWLLSKLRIVDHLTDFALNEKYKHLQSVGDNFGFNK